MANEARRAGSRSASLALQTGRTGTVGLNCDDDVIQQTEVLCLLSPSQQGDSPIRDPRQVNILQKPGESFAKELSVQMGVY